MAQRCGRGLESQATLGLDSASLCDFGKLMSRILYVFHFLRFSSTDLAKVHGKRGNEPGWSRWQPVSAHTLQRGGRGASVVQVSWGSARLRARTILLD